MNQKCIIGFVIILFLYCFALAACKDSDPVVIYQDDEFVVSGVEKPIKSEQPDTSSKNMEYVIDSIDDVSEKRVASYKLTFDYSYSPKNGQSEIKNESMETSYAREQWSASTNLIGVAGNGTDLSVIGYDVSATYPNVDSIDAQFTITADQNGKLTLYRRRGIEVYKEAIEKHREHIRKLSNDSRSDDYMAGQKLIKTYDPVLIEGAGITYQVKEYQADPFPSKGKMSDGKEAFDLSVKTARYEIALQYGEEPIGNVIVENDQHLYSPTENYVLAGTDAWGIIDSGEWRIEKVRDKNSPNPIVLGNDTGLYIFECTFNINRVQENKEEQTIAQLKFVVTADPEGNLTLKPVIAL